MLPPPPVAFKIFSPVAVVVPTFSGEVDARSSSVTLVGRVRLLRLFRPPLLLTCTVPSVLPVPAVLAMTTDDTAVVAVAVAVVPPDRLTTAVPPVT